MNNPNNIFVVVHEFSEDGYVSSTQFEEDVLTREIIGKISIPNGAMASSEMENREKLTFSVLEPEHSSLTIVEIGGLEDLNVIKYEPDLNAESKSKPFKNNNSERIRIKIPNIPIMVRCQNCDTNFPTKYQFQRHQCEFNAEKVVLKPSVEINDTIGSMRIKHQCQTCGKEFVSINNFERHQTSHKEINENVCQHCKKKFVSENRLKIHIENHCKKIGEVSKFYRSDVTVWKCQKCAEIFAFSELADSHCQNCNEYLGNSQKIDEEITKKGAVIKVVTENLLQCEFCNKTYSEKVALLVHQKTHDTSYNYECCNCKEKFESYVSATKHWMNSCDEKMNLFCLPKLVYCEYCERTFKSHELLYNHKIKMKHYTAKICKKEERNGILNEGNNKDKASDAGKLPEEKKKTNPETFLSDKDALVKLIENVLSTMNKAAEKNNQGDGSNVTIENIEINEKNDSDKENKDNGNIGEEIKKKRGRKKKTATKQEMKLKKAWIELEENWRYQCEKCITVFTSSKDLDEHREKEHAAIYSCDDCGQVLQSAKALTIHSRVHKSLKPYVCEQCGRSYSQTSHLWQHMRFHQGIKPFACPHEGCDARYTIRPDLKDHIRKVHTRERPFKCNVCNKCFLTGSVYYQHRLIHTNDRRYACDTCGKKFFRADALNNHKRIHTDEKPFPCEYCGRDFRQKGDKNKHVKTQHQKQFV